MSLITLGKTEIENAPFKPYVGAKRMLAKKQLNTCAESIFGTFLTITKKVRKTRLKSKWDTTYCLVSAEISGSNGTSQKVVQFFRTKCSN